MASEYFSTLQYIWLNIVFFVFSLFLFAACLYACLFVRWVYKRRLRQKTDEMIDSYKNEEDKRRDMELNMKRQELDQPEKKKKASKSKKIHIVTKPCSHVIQKNSKEIIVRQVNENAEAVSSPIVSAQQQPQPVQQQQQQQPPILNMQSGYQPQYVLVPVEALRNGKKVRKTRSTDHHHHQATHTIQHVSEPQKIIVESVATQTSERSDFEGDKKSSEDWLSGFDEKDGERIDLDEETDNESDKVMRRRRHAEEKKVHMPREEVASEETRVSIESAAPPSVSDETPESKTTSATPSTTTSTTTNTTPATSASNDTPSGKAPTTDPLASLPKSEEKDKKPTEDKNTVQSKYYGTPGEKASDIGSNSASQPASISKPQASRPSLFPYYEDPKAPKATPSASKATSKLTDPELIATDSSCALYRKKKIRAPSDSVKVYSGAPKKTDN